MIRIILVSFGLFFALCFRFSDVNEDCPSRIPYMKEFDARKFNGTWYLQQSYNYQAGNFGCVDVEYHWNQRQRSFVVKVNEKSMSNGVVMRYYKRAIQEHVNYTNTGKFFAGYINEWRHFYIVDTDYYNYAIVWTCKFIKYYNASENLYILSRRWDFNITSSEALLKTLEQPYFELENLQEMPQVYSCYFSSNGNWDRNSTLYQMIATAVMFFGFKNLNFLLLIY